MPYVSVDLWGRGDTTNSILEAHRLNSSYIITNSDFVDMFTAEARMDKQFSLFRHSDLAKAVFKYDPSSVLHGVFLERLNGLARMHRCLSGFIEAVGVNVVSSGGVRNDRVAPSPLVLKHAIGQDVSSSDGFGNIIFHRTEYTARSITAYFNLDLAQIRAYRLGENAERFLVTLALWKVRKFLNEGLRLRSACDLCLDGDLNVTSPDNTYKVLDAVSLESALPDLIRACAVDGLFADPPVTNLVFDESTKAKRSRQ